MARKTGSHSEITGPRIRAAALELFAKHGYAAVSMRQIAKEVGVQAGALYLYTADKQSLLCELMIDHMTGLIAKWDALPKGTDPMSQLEAFCKFHIRYHVDRPNEVFIAYMELRNLTPDNFERVEALRKTYETKLEEILQQGKADGLFVFEDSKLTMMAIIAMITGVNTWFREGGRLSREHVENIYWEMVSKVVCA
ncbi:MAG: TetR/AcrR family transcriptional regulator [Halocynthiibacter sp.]